MWPFRRRPKPLPIPSYPPVEVKPPPPAPPKPPDVEVTEAPGEFGMDTIRMKIRRYWNLGE